MSQLERENLEAHVDLCEERYRVLEEKVNRVANYIPEQIVEGAVDADLLVISWG